MAVPATENATVISDEPEAERVAVRVIELPLFSAMELAPAERVTVGALSSSVMVRVTCCVPFSTALPPEGEDWSLRSF